MQYDVDPLLPSRADILVEVGVISGIRAPAPATSSCSSLPILLGGTTYSRLLLNKKYIGKRFLISVFLVLDVYTTIICGGAKETKNLLSCPIPATIGT